jgi:hypothetical protein
MDATKRKRLYELPEYRVLDSKRRKLISFHILDGVAFSRACTMLTLNKTREAKRPDIKACLAAYNRAQDPSGEAALYETVLRMEKMWGLGPAIAGDEDFAAVNLPWNGIYLTPAGKPVDAVGMPVPTPPRPTPAAPTPEALPAIPCSGCEKTIPDGSPRFTRGSPDLRFAVCGHCNHLWIHTGLKPTGPTDLNLIRVEPKWGLNVKTVPDYVEPLPTWVSSRLSNS